MKLKVVDKSGKAAGEITVSDEIFGAEQKSTLLAHYIRTYKTNQRQGTSAAKDRSEVSGGGKKPWRQKGSGRARHGSTRSPLWRTGGITHGPQPKSWNLRLPKKMRQGAMKTALSIKASQDAIKVIDEFSMKAPKTSELKKVFDSLKLEGRVLFVLPSNDLILRKSAENLNNVEVAQASNLNPYEVMKAKNLVFLKDSVEQINNRYATK